MKPFIAAILLLTLAFAGLSPASAATRTATDPFVAEVLRLTNLYRAQNGLSKVVWNQNAGNVAQQWSEELNTRIDKNNLDLEKIHRSGYGSKDIPPGFDWYTENIAINHSARHVVDWWMDSPAHRAGLLSPNATDIGIGYTKTTHKEWYGMTVAVANIAGYASTRAKLPPHPGMVRASFQHGDIAAVDSGGNLYVYDSAKGHDLYKRRYVASGFKGVAQVEVADWNADGVLDVLARWKAGKLTVHYGKPAGGLEKAATVGSSGWGNYDVTATQWKQADTYPTLLARNTVTGRLYHYTNPAGLKHGSRTNLGTGWKSLSIFTADIDGDAKMDVVAKTTLGQLKLYRSNGAGKFVSESRRIIGSSGWNAMKHLSMIQNHLGDGKSGLLARDTRGNLYHYPILVNKLGKRATIGAGGWETLTIGS
ncbi:MAG: CAP domain-containing protein [Actinomycetota bacterium]